MFYHVECVSAHVGPGAGIQLCDWGVSLSGELSTVRCDAVGPFVGNSTIPQH